MMKNGGELNIYNFDDYKKFLKKYIYHNPIRGIIKDMAIAADVHRPYLSKVLNSHIHLLPNQLYGICKFIKLSEQETEFLLLLLEKDRSHKSPYQKYVENKLASIKKNEETKMKSSGRDNPVSMIDENLWIYYSHWIYPLVHISVSIPQLQNIEALCSFFGQKSERIQTTLIQLQKMGFVKKEKEKWVWLQGSWHSSQADPRSLWLHHHLRDLSQQNFQMYPQEGLYFSVTQTLSKKDFETLRNSLIEWIDNFNKTAAPSNPEIPVVFCCDYFQPGSFS